MIPKAYITEWSQQVPWQSNEQVEQDLARKIDFLQANLTEFFPTKNAVVFSAKVDLLLSGACFFRIYY